MLSWRPFALTISTIHLSGASAQGATNLSFVSIAETLSKMLDWRVLSGAASPSSRIARRMSETWLELLFGPISRSPTCLGKSKRT